MDSDASGRAYVSVLARALRAAARACLEHIARHGAAPPFHHYVGFRTDRSGVEVPDWLRERFPRAIVIVLERRFEDLEVDDEGFSVTLYFSGQEARLRVPWSAVENFRDPAAGLDLAIPSLAPSESALSNSDASASSAAPEASDTQSNQESESTDSAPEGAVVSLDDFRRQRDAL